jgi:ABC-2 type transport system permease protein
MSNYIALTRILLKNSLTSFTNNKKGKRNSNKIKNIVLPTIVIISLLPLAGAIGAAVWAAYPIFKEIGQEGLIFASGLMMVSMMIFFFGIFYVMNIFYFSKDVESMLPLPLRPSTIMAAKFTVTLLYEYLTELLFLAPVIIAFRIVSKAGIIYYLYSIIGFLALPVIPLVYAGIINMVLMRFTNISRNRDQFRIIGGVAAMLAAIFINIKSQSFFSSFSDPEQIKLLLTQGNNSLVGVISGIFPANKFFALALVNSVNLKGLVNMLLYIAISILFTALFLTLGESFYFKGVIGISETKSKRKKLTTEQFNRSVVKTSIIKSYTIKELKLLVRTPIYFINCVLMNFIWPLFLFIPLLSSSEDGLGIREIQEFAKSGSNEGMILAIAFAAILFASGTNGVTSTAISREGTNIFIAKYIAVSYHDQIMAKIMSGVILGLVAMLSMLIAAIFILLPTIHLILFILITGVVGVLFTSFLGILIDLNFPKLHWDNEQKAVKQNMNLMFSILISAVVAVAIAVPVVIFQLNVWIVFGALVLIFGFADAVLYGLIKSAGVNLFEKIEA